MTSAAIVARSRINGLEYLTRTGDRFDWTATERDATLFNSARDATRTAMELPAKLRAFALPVLTDRL